MPGIGPVAATFRTARDLSAWPVLAPKPHSSGGKERLGSISKTGNWYIRRLLYLGAMAVISARKRSDPGHDWLGNLFKTKPLKVVAIALANRVRERNSKPTGNDSFRFNASAAATARKKEGVKPVIDPAINQKL